MTEPFVQDADFTLWNGDALEVLAQLPADSVDCAVTSPPFFGLRDYQVDGQIGLEATPDEWVDRLVAVFREVRRVLKPQGTLWVECGDSYGASGGQGAEGSSDGAVGRGPRGPRIRSVKPKDLLGQPWMLAFALRADGWYLRQCIVWHKPNAMPESVRDRCTTAHSYVFLLSKSPRYWFDADAIAEPLAYAPHAPGNKFDPAKVAGPQSRNGKSQWERDMTETWGNESGKNARSVWTIPTSGFAEAHFATFPEALVERMLKAGCPEGGTVLDPFLGSGTTALVARRLNRRSIGIELNADYCEMAARRLQQLSLLAG